MDAMELQENDLAGRNNQMQASSRGDTSEHTMVTPKRIDYILLYEQTNRKDKNDIRAAFEASLRAEGLVLDTEIMEEGDSEEKSFFFSKKAKKSKEKDVNVDSDSKEKHGMCFVKIHAPWETLCRWAELTRMRKPIAVNNIFNQGSKKKKHCTNFTRRFTLHSPALTKPGYQFDTHESDQEYFTSPFDRARLSTFLIEDKETFFTSTERFRLINSILKTTKYSEHAVGIDRLRNDNTYLAAYPLHDGNWKLPKHPTGAKSVLSDRQTLYWTWARPGACLYNQPLELIRQYFGEKIGVYFAWLGFYTQMLIPASILGVLAFLYGLGTLHNDEIQKQVCSSNLVMCPQCDTCSFITLNNSCTYSKITYVFDNTFTVAFAFFMSIWATLFLELWKRRRAALAYKWDTNDINQGEGLVRPEFESVANKSKVNPVTGKPEPFLSSNKKLRRLAVSCTTFLFMLLLVLAALFGVIIYRTILTELAYIGISDAFIRQNSRLIISTTASLINFIIITIMDVLYQKLAIKLTNMEAPRTQDEFEDSYTLKMFLFQAVNYYSSTFYAAFFRGRFVGTPTDYSRLGGYRQEQCDPSGCLIEVCINLAVVMVLKQAINNIKEILVPMCKNWWTKRKSTNNLKEAKSQDTALAEASKDESMLSDKLLDDSIFRDYTLEAFDDLGLFSEYLEMVIQYGFVTLFVTAFPLGPLFALLNNIIEIRLDAYKFVTQLRRVTPDRSNDIGMWFSILQGISVMAVITNGFLIGFTSNFIEQVVYVFLYSPCAKQPNRFHDCLDGYLQSTLANISVELIDIDPPYNSSMPGVPTHCWFDNVDPNRHVNRTPGQSVNDWHVYAAIFIFLFVFEHVVFGLKVFVDILIPDVPQNLMIQAQRQRLLETKLFYEHDISNNTDGNNQDELATLHTSIQYDEQVPDGVV